MQNDCNWLQVGFQGREFETIPFCRDDSWFFADGAYHAFDKYGDSEQLTQYENHLLELVAVAEFGHVYHFAVGADNFSVVLHSIERY